MTEDITLPIVVLNPEKDGGDGIEEAIMEEAKPEMKISFLSKVVMLCVTGLVVFGVVMLIENPLGQSKGETDTPEPTAEPTLAPGFGGLDSELTYHSAEWNWNTFTYYTKNRAFNGKWIRYKADGTWDNDYEAGDWTFMTREFFFPDPLDNTYMMQNNRYSNPNFRSDKFWEYKMPSKNNPEGSYTVQLPLDGSKVPAFANLLCLPDGSVGFFQILGSFAFAEMFAFHPTAGQPHHAARFSVTPTFFNGHFSKVSFAREDTRGLSHSTVWTDNDDSAPSIPEILNGAKFVGKKHYVTGDGSRGYKLEMDAEMEPMTIEGNVNINLPDNVVASFPSQLVENGNGTFRVTWVTSPTRVKQIEYLMENGGVKFMTSADYQVTDEDSVVKLAISYMISELGFSRLPNNPDHSVNLDNIDWATCVVDAPMVGDNVLFFKRTTQVGQEGPKHSYGLMSVVQDANSVNDLTITGHTIPAADLPDGAETLCQGPNQFLRVFDYEVAQPLKPGCEFKISWNGNAFTGGIAPGQCMFGAIEARNDWVLNKDGWFQHDYGLDTANNNSYSWGSEEGVLLETRPDTNIINALSNALVGKYQVYGSATEAKICKVEIPSLSKHVVMQVKGADATLYALNVYAPIETQVSMTYWSIAPDAASKGDLMKACDDLSVVKSFTSARNEFVARGHSCEVIAQYNVETSSFNGVQEITSRCIEVNKYGSGITQTYDSFALDDQFFNVTSKSIYPDSEQVAGSFSIELMKVAV